VQKLAATQVKSGGRETEMFGAFINRLFPETTKMNIALSPHNTGLKSTQSIEKWLSRAQ
jgi:hypothetical protein